MSIVASGLMTTNSAKRQPDARSETSTAAEHGADDDDNSELAQPFELFVELRTARAM